MVDSWGFASPIVCLWLTKRYYRNRLVCSARVAVTVPVVFHRVLWFMTRGSYSVITLCLRELLGCVLCVSAACGQDVCVFKVL